MIIVTITIYRQQPTLLEALDRLLLPLQEYQVQLEIQVMPIRVLISSSTYAKDNVLLNALLGGGRGQSPRGGGGGGGGGAGRGRGRGRGSRDTTIITQTVRICQGPYKGKKMSLEVFIHSLFHLFDSISFFFVHQGILVS